MSNYRVRLPLCGYIDVEVKADNEESAIRAAFEKADYTIDSKNNCTEIGVFELLSQTSSGNVSHVPCRRASADEIEGDDTDMEDDA